jgi:hypothetical protein
VCSATAHPVAEYGPARPLTDLREIGICNPAKAPRMLSIEIPPLARANVVIE